MSDPNEYTIDGLLAASKRGESSKHKMLAWAWERMSEAEMEKANNPASAARARDFSTAPPTAEPLTEEQHLERMARAIYLNHRRRETMLRAWKTLPIERRDAFLALARDVIRGVDAMRASRNAAAEWKP